MKTGLVLGKFMPLHNGHLALFNFALQHCDYLYILLCFTASEPIPGSLRLQWMEQSLEEYNNVKLITLEYNEEDLPATSQSSMDVSRKWANYINKNLPPFDVFFSSETYGDYVAEYINTKHMMFDKERQMVPVSATQIRQHPAALMDLIPKAVRPYFVKKVCLLGSESTGKSILTQRLAAFFNTSFVPEMARDILEHTKECQPEHLIQIAQLHAATILQNLQEANAILVCDTDILITKSYSTYLFNRELAVERWIEEANKMDLYFFLENDCPYVQDGTRLDEAARNELSLHHKNFLQQHNVPYISISGNWEERFNKMCSIIQTNFYRQA